MFARLESTWEPERLDRLANPVDADRLTVGSADAIKARKRQPFQATDELVGLAEQAAIFRRLAGARPGSMWPSPSG
jgi:hypothetical protein